METSSSITSPDQELQYIRKIIADSRASFVEDGKPYIFWGLIVAIGMGVTYLSAWLQRDLYTGYLWMALVLFGWGYMFYYVRNQKRREERARSFVDRIQGSIWGACGTALGLSILLIMLGGMLHPDPDTPSISPLYTCFIASLILGIAYYLSGVANDLKWLSYVGFAWWAGAIVMFIWPSIHVLGLYAAMLILFQVIPGIILQRRYKQITAATNPA
jgi:hypothetical protein